MPCIADAVIVEVAVTVAMAATVINILRTMTLLRVCQVAGHRAGPRRGLALSELLGRLINACINIG